jgi:hypothetical protein
VASRCETRPSDLPAGWYARANGPLQTRRLRQPPASPIVPSRPSHQVRASCAAKPRDGRAARQPAPSASGTQTFPTRRRGTSAHHGLLRSRDIRARGAAASPQFTTVFRVSCTHAPHPRDDAPHDGRSCRRRPGHRSLVPVPGTERIRRLRQHASPGRTRSGKKRCLENGAAVRTFLARVDTRSDLSHGHARRSSRDHRPGSAQWTNPVGADGATAARREARYPQRTA